MTYQLGEINLLVPAIPQCKATTRIDTESASTNVDLILVMPPAPTDHESRSSGEGQTFET